MAHAPAVALERRVIGRDRWGNEQRRTRWLFDGVLGVRGWVDQGDVARPCVSATCTCGASVVLHLVRGRVTDTPCGPRCLSATGPSCECACGGRNHGAQHGGA